jgi:hypothetical protein
MDEILHLVWEVNPVSTEEGAGKLAPAEDTGVLFLTFVENGNPGQPCAGRRVELPQCWQCP